MTPYERPYKPLLKKPLVGCFVVVFTARLTGVATLRAALLGPLSPEEVEVAGGRAIVKTTRWFGSS